MKTAGATAYKLAAEEHVMKAMGELGWPPGQTVGLGILVLVCTAVYVIPRTSVLGAILLTGFLGGATAAKVRIDDASLFFSVVVGVLAWVGRLLPSPVLCGLGARCHLLSGPQPGVHHVVTARALAPPLAGACRWASPAGSPR